ncbi:MAG: flagellar hook-associated protein FlgL [Acidobacteriota bacterium]
MRVVNMLPDIQYEIQKSQTALNTALQQVSTGMRVNQLSDDPSASANLVSSLAASANVDQYTKNINVLQSRMQTADSSISAVVTALNSAITAGTSGANGIMTASNRLSIADQVQGILSNVVAQANGSFQGAYVFGGSQTSTPPFVQAATAYTSNSGTPLSTSTPLTAGSVTTISDAITGHRLVFKTNAGDTIADLTTAIGTAVTAGQLSAGTTASINPSGQLTIGQPSGSGGLAVTTDDTTLGSMQADANTVVANAYAYVGNGTINKVQIGDGNRVGTNVPGDQLFTSGSNVLGSLTGLIAALKGGDTSQIASATSAISNALNAIGQQRIPLDNTLNQMNAQESYLSQETVTLSSQQSSLVGISLATAATNLSQAEQNNSAILAAAAKVLPQTLLDYLH